jgi:hypothetical protein
VDAGESDADKPDVVTWCYDYERCRSGLHHCLVNCQKYGAYARHRGDWMSSADSCDEQCRRTYCPIVDCRTLH